MGLEKNFFPLHDWNLCPPGLDVLKENLRILAAAEHFRDYLDKVIEVIDATEKALLNPDYSTNTFLLKLKRDSYHLAEVFCNEPGITYQALLIIKAKRRISDNYLPNHSLHNEPPYIEPEEYVVPTGTPPEVHEKYLLSKERKLRRLHLFKSVNKIVQPLFRPKNESGPSPTAEGSILYLDKNFYELEALPKLIESYTVPLGSKRRSYNLLRLYEQAERQDSKLPLFEDLEKILASYQQAYQRMASKLQEQEFGIIDSAFNEQKKTLLQAAQAAVAATPQNVIQETLYQTLIDYAFKTIKSDFKSVEDEEWQALRRWLSTISEKTIGGAIKLVLQDDAFGEIRAALLPVLRKAHHAINQKTIHDELNDFLRNHQFNKVKDSPSQALREALGILCQPTNQEVINEDWQGTELNTLKEDLLEALQASLEVIPGKVIQEEMYQSLNVLGNIRHLLLRLIGRVKDELESQPKPLSNSDHAFKIRLTFIKFLIVDATPGYHPGVLASLLDYRRQNPLLFKNNAYFDVQYYKSPLSKEPFRVHVYQGKCYRLIKGTRGFLLAPTPTIGGISHRKENWKSLVMSLAGELFAFDHLNGKVLHSSFLAGGPGYFACEDQVREDGTLARMSNFSGHYKPSIRKFELFAAELQRRGFDTDNILFHPLDISSLKKKHAALKADVRLSDDKKLKAKRAIEIDSEELTLTKPSKFIDGHFQEVEGLSPAVSLTHRDVEPLPKRTPFNYKKALLITGMVALAVVGVLLITALILATKGIAAPIIGAVIYKAVIATTPYVLLPMAGVSTALMTIPLLVIGKIFSLGQRIANRMSSLIEKIFGKKDSEVQINTSSDATANHPNQHPGPQFNYSRSTMLPRADAKPSHRSYRGSVLVAVESIGNTTQDNDAKVCSWEIKGNRTHKSNYPEWFVLVQTMEAVKKKEKNNLGQVLTDIETMLDDLKKRVLKRDFFSDGARISATIWTQGNVLKLLLEIAEGLKEDQAHLQQIEHNLFKPLCEKVTSFWNSFDARKDESLFTRYQQALANQHLYKRIRTA